MNTKDIYNFFEMYVKDNPTKKEEPPKYPNVMKVTKKDLKFDRIGRIKRKSCCYFCGFDIIVHKHHIINRIEGGNGSKENILIICPNHHRMIHTKRFELRWWDGYLFLYDNQNPTDMLFPHPMQHGYKRELPKWDIWKRIDTLRRKGLIIEA